MNITVVGQGDRSDRSRVSGGVGHEGSRTDASPLGQRLVQEQEEWSQFVRQHLDPHARLAYVSPLDSDRRTYRCGSRIMKVRRVYPGRAQLDRQFGQDLRQEFLVLSHLDRKGFDISPAFTEMPGWRILTMDVIDGKSFSEVWRDRRFLGRANLLWATEAAILRLNRAGVCHDDVAADNVRIDSSGRVRLVDFGDASLRHPIAATVREHAALLFGRHALFLRFAKRVVLMVMPGARDVYRRAKLRRLAPFSMKVADEVTAAPFTAELQLLQRGWRKAVRWNSGRTEWLAYPSLTVAGVHYAGWRPWLLRWNRIVELVDFRNRNVIDIGCNIGLLPSFAMLYGARSAMGVDADATLVEAAGEVAAGLGVPATFRQQDFDSPQPWEDDLPGADLVVAMSIVEWVSDRARLLGFIGKHNEVLYEGHESLAVESERLRSVGFSQIEVVMVSDRGRPLLYGRKA